MKQFEEMMKMMSPEDMKKFTEEMMKMMKPEEVAKFFPFAPQVKATKSGYEIRSKLLELAQTQVFTEFNSKIQLNDYFRIETETKVTKVTAPTLDDVMEVAKRFSDFVNNKHN